MKIFASGRKFFLAVFILFALCCISFSDSFTKQYNILYVTDCHVSSQKTREHLEGVIRSLPKNFIIHTIFLHDSLLDSINADSALSVNVAAAIFNSNYYDGIIAGTNESYKIIREIRDKYLGSIPLVYAGCWGLHDELNSLTDRYVIGLDEKIYYEENILMAKRLFPKNANIVVLTNDKTTTEMFENLLPSFDSRFSLKFTLKDFSDADWKTLPEMVESIPEDAVAISAIAAECFNYNFHEGDEAVSYIAENIKCPVISCRNSGIGSGFLGGFFLSYYEQGELAAKAVSQMIQGVFAQYINLSEDMIPAFIFDASRVLEYGITLKELPEGCRLVNIPPEQESSLAKTILLAALNGGIALIIVFIFIYFIRKINILNQSIKEERNKLNAVIDQSDTVCWECDFQNGIETLKNDTSSFSGFSSNDIAQGWIDSGIIKDEYRSQYNAIIQELQGGKPFVQLDLPMGLKDMQTHIEDTKWKRIVYRGIKFQNGRIVKALGTATDITAQKRAEEQYNGIMAYRSFTNKDFPAYTRLNLTRNTVMQRLFNVPEFSKFVTGNSADCELKMIREMISFEKQNDDFVSSVDRMELLTDFVNGVRKKDCDFYYKFSNGSIHWYNFIIELTSHPRTNEIEAYCHLVDVTNEKVEGFAKDSVVNEEVDFIFWLNIATSICRFVDKEGIEWVPDESEFDYSRLLEFFVENYIFEEDVPEFRSMFEYQDIRNAVDEDNPLTHTFRVRGESGLEEIKQLRVSMLNSNVLVFTCRDVTDITLQEKQQNEKLRAAMELAESANSAKSDFLSRMSHDLRTPMNGVIGIAELAEDEIDNPDAIREDLRKIKSSSKYMVGLLNDILDMSKIESGKLELHYTKESAGEIIENINTLVLGLCEKNRIDYYCNLDTQKLMDYYVSIDRLHIQQIAMNLLSNATKYTPEGGRIEFLLTMLSEDADGLVDLQVEINDTGSGMTEEFQRTMYMPFTQDSNSVNKVGTGLGLAIVHSLIELMDGTIDCISAPGEGTKFTIRFKIKHLIDETGKKSVEVKSVEKEPFSLVGKNVLVVEDNELNQEIVKRLLQKEGMNVDIADNGLIALNKFSECEPGTYDIVLMDMMMPVMGGLEATHLLRSLEHPDAKKIPVIAMTANAFAEDIQQCIDAGMNTHLSKPIDPKLMMKVIAEYLQ